MADKKISQLTSGSPAQAADEYVVARGGANYKLTLTNIAATMPPIGASTPNTGAFTTLSSSAGANFATSSGNVGIGTTSPTQKLSISGSGATLAGTAAISLWDSNSAGSRRWSISNGSGGNVIDLIGKLVFSVGSGSSTADPMQGSAAMTLDASGRLGIGTTSPASGTRLHMVDSAGCILRLVRTSNRFDLIADTDFLDINARDSGTYLRFLTADTERARITSGGTFQTNTAGPYGINLNQDTATATNSSRLFLTNSSGGHSFHKSAGNTVFSTGATDGSSTGTAAIIFNEYGIGLGSGNNPTSGIGIKFPATQSASSNANTLDDYEEGTWTPSVTFGGASTGITYSSGRRFGSYTKIGNTVYYFCHVELTNKGSSTGTANITGLPFTVNNTGDYYMPGATFLASMASMASNLEARAVSNTTQFDLYQVSSSSYLAIADTNFTNGTGIQICGFYIV